MILLSDSDPTRWSGFLIDNFDDEQKSFPVVPPSSNTPSATAEQYGENTVEPSMTIVNVACAERQEESKCRTPKKKCAEQLPPNNNHPRELSSDLIVENDTTHTDQISQLIDVAEKMSKATTDESKMAHINMIVTTIKEQQAQLKKLRTQLMSVLDEESKSNLTDPDQDALMKFINQPITSGCWLCSGKVHTEVTTQCSQIDQP